MDVVGLIAAVAGLVTAVGSLISAAVVLSKARAERRKIEAERAKVEAETGSLAKRSDLERAMEIVDQLQEDNKLLRVRLSEMEARDERRDQEIMTLKSGILMLIAQLRGLGIEPVWQPDWACSGPAGGLS